MTRNETGGDKKSIQDINIILTNNKKDQFFYL